MFTSAYLSAQNDSTSTIPLTATGVVIPLGDNVVSEGITATGDEFTVNDAGMYYIAYKVQPVGELAVTTSVRANGTEIPGLTSSAVATGDYSSSGITRLEAGDVVGLYAAGTGDLTLSTPSGARLTLIKLSD